MNVIERIKKMESIINEKLKSNNVLVKISSSKNQNKGTISIFKDKKVNRIFEVEAISSCQINIIENGKTIEYGVFRDNVGMWIYNLYNPVEYFDEFYGKKLNGLVLTRKQVKLIANDYTKDYSKEKGERVHKKELDNQPKVQGYLGPMFGKIDYGKIYLRYETQEIYDMLSS